MRSLLLLLSGCQVAALPQSAFQPLLLLLDPDAEVPAVVAAVGLQILGIVCAEMGSEDSTADGTGALWVQLAASSVDVLAATSSPRNDCVARLGAFELRKAVAVSGLQCVLRGCATYPWCHDPAVQMLSELLADPMSQLRLAALTELNKSLAAHELDGPLVVGRIVSCVFGGLEAECNLQCLEQRLIAVESAAAATGDLSSICGVSAELMWSTLAKLHRTCHVCSAQSASLRLMGLWLANAGELDAAVSDCWVAAISTACLPQSLTELREAAVMSIQFAGERQCTRGCAVHSVDWLLCRSGATAESIDCSAVAVCVAIAVASSARRRQ